MFRTRSLLFGCMLAISALSFKACRTSPLVTMGIQPEFTAINPSRILAVPLFVLPDPGAPSSIDVSALETGNVRSLLESEVLEAFRNQPGVNGVSFSAVRQTIGKPPNIWNTLDSQMRSTALKLNANDSQDGASVSTTCLKRKNFIDFYEHCLAKQKAWVSGLNALSAKALNADSALLTVVTKLEKNEVDRKYGIGASVAVVLVDTNTGRMIWGRQAEKRLETQPEATRFPEWGALFNSLLDESFWVQFPGRKPSTQTSAPAKN